MRVSILSGTRNWMSCIDDNKSLANISMPGTHNSCARQGASGKLQWIDQFVATQSSDSTITKQLNAGIRYLDIRCCAINGAFTIHHEQFYLHLNFADVLDECVSFLGKHRSETIIMRVRQENSSLSVRDFGRIFNQVYSLYHKWFHFNNDVPRLGEVRGKIVLITTDRLLKGMSYTSASIQDDYEDTDSNSKRKKIINHAIKTVKAKTNNTSYALFINYCSASAPPWTSPRSFSKNIIPFITQSFKEGFGADYVDNRKNEAACVGIIVMDFYTKELVAEIIKRNQNKHLKGLAVHSIYNNYYGRHYFYASKFMDGPGKRREVCGWEPGNKIRNGYWMFIPHNIEKHQYYIYNTYYKEFLYASAHIKNKRRAVYTWVDGTPEPEAIWTIMGDLIYNNYYNCFLYESGLSFMENRKLIPCWQPGHAVNQCHWHWEQENKSVG